MGAKTYYAARIVKESAQREEIQGGEIPHPWNDERGDMIAYFNSLTDQNSFHARSLDIKASCTVNLGINVVEGDEDAVKKRLECVNDYGESFEEVINKVALDFETNGNGYLEGVRGRGGNVEELYFCPSVETYRRPRSEDTPFLYRSPDGGDVEFPRFVENEKVERFLVHFAQSTQQNRHYGLPSWKGAVPDLELDYYATLYNQKFFINSGIPDLAIIVEGGQFDEETEKQVVAFVQDNLKGVDNSQRTLYLPISDGDIKVRFEKLGMEKDKDGSFGKLRESCRDRVLSAHGVPPRLAGVVTAGQLGGGGEVEGQLAIFQEVTISPRQRYFAGKINPVLRAMGLDATIAFQGLNTSAHEKDSERAERLYTAGIITLDEARESVDYAPTTELDKPETETGTGEPFGKSNVVVLRRLESLRKAL